MSQTSVRHHPRYGGWVEHIPACTEHLTPWTDSQCKQINIYKKTNKERLTGIFRLLFSFMGLVGVSEHGVRKYKQQPAYTWQMNGTHSQCLPVEVKHLSFQRASNRLIKLCRLTDTTSPTRSYDCDTHVTMNRLCISQT